MDVSSLSDLPPELLLHIHSYLATNQEACTFVQLSRKIRRLCQRNGYLKHLSLDNYIDFLNNLSSHQNSVQHITIESEANPHSWLPLWVEKMEFRNCLMSHPIVPEKPTRTRYLSIVDAFTPQINVDWSKFPKLKTLYVQAHHLNLEGLENIQSIENLILCLTIQQDLIPYLQKFPCLQTFFSTCVLTRKAELPTTQLHSFVVEHQGLTTPNGELKPRPYINIQEMWRLLGN